MPLKTILSVQKHKNPRRADCKTRIFINILKLRNGEEGIRTLDTISSIQTFQVCAFNRSATSPNTAGNKKIKAFHL